MKVECYRDGDCELCRENLPEGVDNDTFKVGDILTVVDQHVFPNGWTLLAFAEFPPCGDCGEVVFWCSCCFRPLGDPDAWSEIMKKHKSKPKIKELEPA